MAERIAVGCEAVRNLAVFDTATGRLIARHTSAHASPIAAMAFSGDGARLATADAEGTIKIWADLQKLNSKSAALLTLKGHQGAIHTVGFSSDGKRLVTTSADKTARVWDLENAGAAIRPLERFRRSSARGTLFAGWATDRRGQRQQRASLGRRHGATRAGNCHPATRVESPASHSRRPTTACWLSGTADKPTFLMSRCGTSMPERNWRGCRERPICPTFGRTNIQRRSVRWRFRLMGNIWSPDSAQGLALGQYVLPIR